MDAITHPPLTLNCEDGHILAELLDSERARLLVEIRHTGRRAFRDILRRRLAAIDRLAIRCRESWSAE